MFTKKKLIISMLLVAAIVAGMVVPAFADTATGSGSCNGYSYKYEVYFTSTRGYAKIQSSGQPTEYSARASNKLRYKYTGTYGTSVGTISTGYACVTGMADNMMTINNVPVEATVIETRGTFWVNSTCVGKDILAD